MIYCTMSLFNSLDHLRVFGCFVFDTYKVRNVDKFPSRAIIIVFIGYFSLQKGTNLIFCTQRSFFVSRDVVFKETSYSPNI